jgi:hypothetical protein
MFVSPVKLEGCAVSWGLMYAARVKFTAVNSASWQYIVYSLCCLCGPALPHDEMPTNMLSA